MSVNSRLNEAEFALLAHPPDLRGALGDLLRQIPVGAVTSFGDLAEGLGDLSAARWVAAELQQLDAEEFPVHRVIRRTGQLTAAQNLSLAARLDKLRGERIEVEDESVNLQRFGWNQFSGPQPLEQLRRVQARLAQDAVFTPLAKIPARIAAVDVSYVHESCGVAAYVMLESLTGKLLYAHTHTAQTDFPYIPGYLAFRELPLYLALLEQVRNTGVSDELMLVDGNGILHPRRAGIATMLGCAWSLCTVGVGKHLLCGRLLEPEQPVSPIVDQNQEILGYRLERGSKRRMLYVSPGTGIDLAGALRVVDSQLRDHRLPEPIFHADHISRDAARKLMPADP